VPLLVHWPEGLAAGRVVQDPVSLADLAPTIYELLGVEAPPGIEGKSLVPLLNGGRDQSRLVYAHLHTPKRPIIWAMVRQGKEKYLEDLNAPRAELYELDVDPGEQRNRISEATSQGLATPLLVWLAQQWGAYRALPSAERNIVIDSQNIQKLRALGYVD
jgi:arylsulfatase